MLFSKATPAISAEAEADAEAEVEAEAAFCIVSPSEEKKSCRHCPSQITFRSWSLSKEQAIFTHTPITNETHTAGAAISRDVRVGR